MKSKKYWALMALTAGMMAFSSCKNDANKADAYGNFESREVTVSAETPGRLLSFGVEEGMDLQPGQVIAQVDTTQLYLQVLELQARRRAAGSKTSNVVAQMDVVKEQLAVLKKEQVRVENLLKAGAATPKQLDDLKGQIEVLEQQRKSVGAQNLPVANEIEAIDANIARLRDQIKRSTVLNPVKGRVTVKLSERSELVAAGKPLYRLAPMDSLYLRAYIAGSQLADLKLGQGVQVRIDDGAEGYRNFTGIVTWVSDQAEFTPKIVQTKEERVNLVYAFKVKVPNDGSLKIGMPGEVVLDANKAAQTAAK